MYRRINVFISNVFIFLSLIVFSSTAQSINLFDKKSIINCNPEALMTLEEKSASALVTEDRSIGILGSITKWVRGFQSGLNRQSPKNHLPLSIDSIEALDRVRNDLNRGIISPENAYVSFTIEDNYLRYGHITSVELRRGEIIVFIELLDESSIPVTGVYLYSIGVSEKSRDAFAKRGSRRIVLPTPRIRKGQDVLVPLDGGGFSHGIVMEFMGDEAEVSFRDSRSAYPMKRVIPIELLQAPFKPENIISIKGLGNDDSIFYAVILGIMENGMLHVRGIRNDIQIRVYPENIYEIIPSDRFISEISEDPLQEEDQVFDLTEYLSL